jgi:Fe2+ transport system protein FeoA
VSSIERKRDTMTENVLVPLHTIHKGSRALIVQVPDGKGKSQLIRLGILKGEFIRCLEHLPGGTVVIEKNRREIAIGVSLAKSIIVAYANNEYTEGRVRKKYV